MCDVINLDARRKTPRKETRAEIAMKANGLDIAENAQAKFSAARAKLAREAARPPLLFTTASGDTFDLEDLK